METPAQGGPGAGSKGGPSTGARVRLWLMDKGTPVLVMALLFLAWEVAVRVFKVPQFVLPGPWEIVSRMFIDWRLILQNATVTIEETLVGFAVSALIGIPLAIGIVYSPLFEKVSYTVIVSLQTIPKVALAPILVLWFGYGLMPKVAVAFLISFFPIVISTVVGLRSVEQEMIYLARSLGASELQTFVKIRFPKALPSTFGGLKVGIGEAVVGSVVGEFIAAEKGLGYLQLVSNVHLDTVLTFAAVIAISLVGVVLFYAMSAVERLVIPWHQVTEGRQS
ncbi:MAG: ABC transporter permease [Bacillota bacterium]